MDFPCKNRLGAYNIQRRITVDKTRDGTRIKKGKRERDRSKEGAEKDREREGTGDVKPSPEIQFIN